MLPFIEEHLSEIIALCKKHSVKRLDLFGSAAWGDFNPVRSDVDFFVEFMSYEDPLIAEHWFGLQEDLEKLLGHRADMTSLRTARNPYFLQVANRSRVTLYAA